MDKKEAKEEIKKLIRKYESLTLKEKKYYNEAMTRKDFIMPLFSALGWDVYNDFIHNEVVEEEPAVKGTVDYSFRLNNIPQFLLEAKSIKVDLDKIEWAKQAVSYGWNMGIEWVILTDFEGLKLFNASWKVDIPHPNLEFTYKEYLSRFDDLWFFSKESFQKRELDKQAEKWGIRTKRIEVDEKLASDLIEWRKKLFDNFSQWNAKRTESEIDEAVQRILDRFIFIRSCEDRNIEPPILWPAFQRWQQDIWKHPNFLETLKPIFKEFDKKYNSNLFLLHFCEELNTEGTPFFEIINGLYGDKESGVKYNFAAIKPDILGKVYEQYLGHLLQKAGKKGEDIGKTKRKKHGIYYTPTFVVDYIVKSALGPVLDRCKTIHDLKKIKVLDPACGSGSFLVKALEMINDKYKKLGAKGDGFTKIQIVTENIYGVDIDEQAVEIARLNLLLNVLNKQIKLPLLSNNIKNGNSLIFGTDKDLKKYFGKNFKEKKPFNWKEEFPSVFKQGGFDVIIGNPPWVESRKLEKRDKEYFKYKYNVATKQYDLFSIFIEKGISVLKNESPLGFIVPNRYITNLDYGDFRKFLLENCKLLQIIDVGEGIFEGVQMPASIIILQKSKDTKDHQVIISEKINEAKHMKKQKEFLENKNFEFTIYENQKSLKVIKKVEANSELFGNIVNNYRGVEIGKRSKLISAVKTKDNSAPFLVGEDLDRYRIKNIHYLKLSSENVDYKDSNIYIGNKILVRKTGLGIKAYLDKEDLCVIQVIYIFKLKNNLGKYKEAYFLAILNSNLMNFYYFNRYGERDRKVFPHLTQGKILQLPIHKIDFSKSTEKIKHDEIVILTNRMLKLNKEIQKIPKNSEKWYLIESEIKKVDRKIDQEVYKLYDLTPEEIKIVEGRNT